MKESNRGFTLIELLITLVVIGILVSLVSSGVFRAIKTAKDAAIATEIQSLKAELTSFQTKYGAYPPSRIVFAEDGDYSDDNLGDYVQLRQRSLSHLRRFWPRLALRTDGVKPKIPGGWYDFNGDHIVNKPYIIEGHECLAMFLGGVPSRGKDGVALMGFAKNPLNPFMSNDPPPEGKSWPSSSNRYPGFDFAASRLAFTQNPTIDPGEGQLVAYEDIYGGFYAYFSSYGGSGYDPDDINMKEDFDGSVDWYYGGFQTNGAATPVLKTERKDIVASPGPNPYTSDEPIASDGDGKIDLKSKRMISYYNIRSFQIISSGKDRTFGIGGAWRDKVDERLPFWPAVNGSATSQELSTNVRNVEKDNVTNFSGGDLD